MRVYTVCMRLGSGICWIDCSESYLLLRPSDNERGLPGFSNSPFRIGLRVTNRAKVLVQQSGISQQEMSFEAERNSGTLAMVLFRVARVRQNRSVKMSKAFDQEIPRLWLARIEGVDQR